MTKRAKIIIGALIVALLGLGIIAGLTSKIGTNPAKSSTQIKKEVEDVLAGKDYFESVEVTTYSGMNEEADPEAKADSAGIVISLTDMSAENFKEVTTLLSATEMTVFYSIGDTADIANIINVTGFQNADLKNVEKVESIATSLKVQEEYKGSYWQVSPGDAEGVDGDKMKTQFVSKHDKAADIRKTVNAVLTPKMDVLPVLKTELSVGSFSQFAAIDGKMDNYDKGLEIGLKFADAVFLESKSVVMLGLGDDIQVSYEGLRKGLDQKKLVEIAKELNKDQLYKITVVSPEDVAKAKESAEGTAPLESEEAAESSESNEPKK